MSDDTHTTPPIAPSDANVADVPEEHYFRTFAKDAALLGKTGGASPAPTPAPVAIPPKPPTPEKEVELPPAHIIPKAPSTNETREAVLARLRGKVEKTPVASTPKPAAAPQGDREEVLARLKARAEAPVVPQKQQVKRIEHAPLPSPMRATEAPAPIHTYKTDFTDRAKETGASRITMLAKEQDTRERAPQVLRPKSTTPLLFGGGALLIVLGIASVWLAYSLIQQTPIVPLAPNVPSLILPNARVEVAGDTQALRSALLDLEERVGDGEVAVAYMTFASSTPDGKTLSMPAEGGALIAALSLDAPDIVLRNIRPESTVGVVNSRGEARPFFILRVSSYERTFAGMLSWEATMGGDLAFFYPPPATIAPQVATSTASTTMPSLIAYTPRFVDRVIENHDTRVLYGADGSAVIVYGYKDKETLIITGGEEAFSEIVKRLQSAR